MLHGFIIANGSFLGNLLRIFHEGKLGLILEIFGFHFMVEYQCKIFGFTNACVFEKENVCKHMDVFFEDGCVLKVDGCVLEKMDAY